MGTPFDTATPAALVTAATAGQLGFIETLLSERDWRDAERLPAKHISRAAVLNMLIGWVLGKTSVPEPVRKHIDAGATDGENVNALLAATMDDSAPDMAYCWAPLTKAGASALIEWLKGLPYRSIPATAAAADVMAQAVPAGRYAIDTQVHAVNGTAFYKVDRPTEGKWAGRVFVKQIIGDDEQRLSQKQGGAIISRIAAVGAQAAAARYGHEIGECGMCGRTLTNDESRARGIGPICAAKAGW